MTQVVLNLRKDSVAFQDEKREIQKELDLLTHPRISIQIFSDINTDFRIKSVEVASSSSSLVSRWQQLLFPKKCFFFKSN